MQSKFIIKPHYCYTDDYLKKLNQPTSVATILVNLCSGWYLETFKQVLNKLSKNKSSPLPLYFPNAQAMSSISKNKPLLKKLFILFDTRDLGRIDASELYSILLVLSKGSYQAYLKAIVDIFGFESVGRINRNQFFFFLDSYYRALPKVLIIKGKDAPIGINYRLDSKQINRFLDVLYEEGVCDIERNEIYEAMMKVPELNEFMKYLQKRCSASAENYRNTAIDRIKMEAEVRECMKQMLNRISAEGQ